MVLENFRAKRELNNIQLDLKTLKKPSIILPETYVDIPEEYNYPHINVIKTEVEANSQQKLKTLQASNQVYVKLSSEDNPDVHVEFVYVVFKGTYYIVLQVGINTPNSELVIVSITNFVRDPVLNDLETKFKVIDTITLYEAKNANDLMHKDVIIKMLLKKYPSICNLSSNDAFFTEGNNTISRISAFNYSEFSFDNFSYVVKLCIHERRLYLCIGTINSSYNPPSYDLYLYKLDGNRYTESFSFQSMGIRNEMFDTIKSETGIRQVNNMKFYDLNKALISVSSASTSSVGSRHTSTNMPVPTKASSDLSNYGGNTNDTSWLNHPSVLMASRQFDDMGWGNRGGSCRRKTKRKYKRTRTSKINKKARKTHTRRIRR